MHAVALEADDDDDDDGVDGVDGSYITPYDRLDIDDVMKQRVWSVEHVLPRSRVMDATSDAKSDPLGWTTATRSANSKRSNHYLMLWQDQVDGQLALPGTTVRIEGQLHFVPPLDQRARLARKWAYIRATYAGDLSPPSRAQIKYAPEIMALAKTYPIHPAEQRVNDIYKRMFDWSNPLLKDGADDWYDNVEWRSLVFS